MENKPEVIIYTDEEVQKGIKSGEGVCSYILETHVQDMAKHVLKDRVCGYADVDVAHDDSCLMLSLDHPTVNDCDCHPAIAISIGEQGTVIMFIHENDIPDLE